MTTPYERKKFKEKAKKLGCSDIDNLIQNTEWVRFVAEHSREYLEDLDRQFSKKTGLNKRDFTFLFLAVALQVIRQYLLTSFPERLDDQEAAKQTPGHNEEHSDRHHRYYNPSLTEIITNPVPFDASVGSDGALAGGGILGHRATAIGHDPLLGLLFGTANIATATLTTWKMDSYHIGTHDSLHRDYFKNHADTGKVFYYLYDKLVHQGIDGKVIVAASLGKEIVHLRSDIQTKHSLPLPVISVVSPQWASTLAEYGVDTLNVQTVMKQAAWSILIDTLIALIHGAFFTGTSAEERQLYQVKTRKVLLYSNLLASASNVLYVAISTYMGNANALRKLDIGGLAKTLYRLITDVNFIYKVKEEFILNHLEQKIRGDEFVSQSDCKLLYINNFKKRRIVK